VFFCRFNDPIYVKLEKVDVLVKVADNNNVDSILAELKEYATDIDLDLVRKAMRAIGHVAVKVERAAKRATEIVADILEQEGAENALQDAVVVAKDIFRKYPNKFEGIIATICKSMEKLHEADAKAAFIWIIGEYAEKIENVDKMLEFFIESFSDETTQVQLQILTAAVKLYIKKPEDTEDLITNVLKLATEESTNPDLRDRGYIYWRMLSTDPVATKFVVLSDKPSIADDSYNPYDGTFVDQLIEQIGTLASVYHVLPSELEPKPKKKVTIQDDKKIKKGDDETDEEEEDGDEEEDDDEEEEDDDEEEEKPKKKKEPSPKASPKKEKKIGGKLKKPESINDKKDAPVATAQPSTDINDLLGLDDFGPSNPIATSVAPMPGLMDIGGFGVATQPAQAQGMPSWAGGFMGQQPAQPPAKRGFSKAGLIEILPPTQGGAQGRSGVSIQAQFAREGSDIKLELNITNHSQVMLNGVDYAIQLNKNSFALAAGPVQFPNLSSNQSSQVIIPINIDANNLDNQNPPTNPFMVQTALKTSLDVFFFSIKCNLNVLLNIKDKISADEFKNYWSTT
jgi:AP-1 complex subunit beta-1